MDETEKTLASIKVGECLTVRAISGNASARLFDLGFSLKAEIRCLGTAPLGDPLMLSVGGRVIAVRKRDLMSITVGK
jgi:Fe2+ transport system protein FeoA